MRLFYGGAEAPTLRRRLKAAGATRFAVSFWHLRDRLPKSGEFPFDERFPEGSEILLDSGGYTANKRREEHDDDYWIDYLDHYVDLVSKNLARLELVTEFDFLDYSNDDIWALRFDVWNALPPEKFLPVWHPERGWDELVKAATTYPQVAIPGSAIETVAHRLPALSNRYGCRFHGLAVNSQELIERGGLASVSSTAWTSAMRHGERAIFDGSKLHRYGKGSKDTAIRQHRPLLERAGFDIEDLLDEEPEELTRLAVWSLDAWSEFLSRKLGLPSTPGAEESTPNTEPEDSEPATPPSDTRNLPVSRTPGERTLLPILGSTNGVQRTTDEHGNVHEVNTERQITSRSDSARQCDSCYIRNACPEFVAGQGCAYDIPVEIKSKEQLIAVMTSLLEMQVQRAMFARFAEELEGGYPSKAVSLEFDRVFELTEKMKDIQDNRDFLRVSIEGRAHSGVLSRLFGDQAGAQARELDNPMNRQQTNEFLSDVVEAEVME